MGIRRIFSWTLSIMMIMSGLSICLVKAEMLANDCQTPQKNTVYCMFELSRENISACTSDDRTKQLKYVKEPKRDDFIYQVYIQNGTCVKVKVTVK